MAAAVTREAAEVWGLTRRRPQELRGVRVRPGIGSAGRCGQPEEAGQPHGAVALAAVSIADEVGGLIAAHDGNMVKVVESLGVGNDHMVLAVIASFFGRGEGYPRLQELLDVVAHGVPVYNDLVVVDLRLQFGWRSSPGWWSLAGGAIERWYRCRWTTEPDAAYREKSCIRYGNLVDLLGHLEVLQWARANGCPWDKSTCTLAASGGHLETLQWARVNGCPWDSETLETARFSKRHEVVRWALANGCPQQDA
ncbi:hypothetical protein JKP88DRAFT_351103 [Tribonema minus]|uniref:Uncharacterized protein n=1 Tax=Tribonema minus TaxID=303371 RepID=A0A835YTQ8_9STRA|nr:hypothetical protein JKP88DRAFT_351103 [Tribonema minus]